MRVWFSGMIAVCGIGRPSGRRNSATTAYQSAMPPIVAASANAATKDSQGHCASKYFASAKIATQRQRAPVAMAFVRRSAASFSASSKPEEAGCVSGSLKT